MGSSPASGELDLHLRFDGTSRTELIDRHFEVREAIGAVMSAPTTASRAEVRRAVRSFLAAQRALSGAADPTLADDDHDERQAQLLTALEELDDATSRRAVHEAAEALRHRFLDLSRVHLP
jgi:hypothetical protein